MQWHTPIGYKVLNGKIVIYEEHRKIVEQIFRDYDSGVSALRIAKDLKDRGVKNAHDRVGWSHASIGRILENYNYLGTEDYEQIIDKELFERVQKRREQVRIEGSRGKHRPNKRERLIFSGVLICAECGCPYYANNHQGFCVEYLLCDMQKKYIFPVTYEPERVSANAITTNLLYEYMKMKEEGREYTDTSADANVYLQMLILSLAAKHKSWEHEREYRIICHRDDFPAIPSKIYIGLNCKEEYRKELIEVGRSIDVCKVYQMEFDEDSEVFGLKQRLLL